MEILKKLTFGVLLIPFLIVFIWISILAKEDEDHPNELADW